MKKKHPDPHIDSVSVASATDYTGIAQNLEQAAAMQEAKEDEGIL